MLTAPSWTMRMRVILWVYQRRLVPGDSMTRPQTYPELPLPLFFEMGEDLNFHGQAYSWLIKKSKAHLVYVTHSACQSKEVQWGNHLWCTEQGPIGRSLLKTGVSSIKCLPISRNVQLWNGTGYLTEAASFPPLEMFQQQLSGHLPVLLNAVKDIPALECSFTTTYPLPFAPLVLPSSIFVTNSLH